MNKRDIITFLSDYGLEDEFVGVCRSVMLKIAPHLRVIDLHHNIRRQDIRHGAVILQQAISFLPDAVHLAVVDPTVGSARRALAIEATDGQIFIGPDNGLLIPVVSKCGGAARAFELTNPTYLLEPISQTFQGRDVFAPAAAHIATGVDPSELGDEVDPSALVPLEIPQAWAHDDHLHAEVLQPDRFGNLQLNFSREHLKEVGLEGGDRLEIRLEGHRLTVPLGNTFADVGGGEFVLVEDSYRHLSLAVNKGDAAARLQAKAGSTVIVGPARS